MLLASAGCSPKPTAPAPNDADGPAWFEDVTDAVGLDFVHDPGPTDAYFMPQCMGSGAAFIHDRATARNALPLLAPERWAGIEIGQPPVHASSPTAQFKDVTEGSGLGVAGFSMGVASAT